MDHKLWKIWNAIEILHGKISDILDLEIDLVADYQFLGKVFNLMLWGHPLIGSFSKKGDLIGWERRLASINLKIILSHLILFDLQVSNRFILQGF